MLSRKHGATLCYTPMINARTFVRSDTYREEIFTTCEGDRPLIAQFAGDDPAVRAPPQPFFVPKKFHLYPATHARRSWRRRSCSSPR